MVYGILSTLYVKKGGNKKTLQTIHKPYIQPYIERLRVKERKSQRDKERKSQREGETKRLRVKETEEAS